MKFVLHTDCKDEAYLHFNGNLFSVYVTSLLSYNKRDAKELAGKNILSIFIVVREGSTNPYA